MQYSQWVSMLILWNRTTFRSLSKPVPASKICNYLFWGRKDTESNFT